MLRESWLAMLKCASCRMPKHYRPTILLVNMATNMIAQDVYWMTDRYCYTRYTFAHYYGEQSRGWIDDSCGETLSMTDCQVSAALVVEVAHSSGLAIMSITSLGLWISQITSDYMYNQSFRQQHLWVANALCMSLAQEPHPLLTYL